MPGCGTRRRRTPVWLRSSWDGAGVSRFSFSLDGKVVRHRPRLPACLGRYRGDRLGVYSFNPRAEAGFIDVDTFQYGYASQTGKG